MPDLRPQHLGEVTGLVARRAPDRVALVDGARSLTYGELDRAVEAIAGRLRSDGIVPGDRVALVVGNRPEFFSGYFGVMRAGAIVVPIGPMLSAPEMRFQIEHSGTRVILHTGATEQLVAAAAAGRPIDLDRVAARSGRWAATSSAGTVLDVNADSEAAIFYTSGTTASPKGVRLTHRGILHCVSAVSEYFEIADTDVTLSALPLYHSATHFAALPTLVHGGTLVLQERFHAEETFALLARHRVTLFPAVTAIAILMAKLALSAGTTPGLPALRKAFIGGAAVPEGLLADWARFAPHTAIVNTYGLTEMSPAVCGMDPTRDQTKRGSVGRPYRDIELRIDAIDEPLATGSPPTGEILVRGPSQMIGYWNNPEATAAALTDGWLRTGDLGYLDDGYLFIVGRKKHMVKRGGENVFPNEVEAVLSRIPEIKEVAVVAVPDDVMGERVGAMVVPQPGATVSPAEVLAACQDDLAPFKIPEYVAILDHDLPKNAANKVDARLLFAALVLARSHGPTCAGGAPWPSRGRPSATLSRSERPGLVYKPNDW